MEKINNIFVGKKWTVKEWIVVVFFTCKIGLFFSFFA